MHPRRTRLNAAAASLMLGAAAAPPQDMRKAGGASVTICSFMRWVP